MVKHKEQGKRTIIGVTGGISSGKTRICNWLAEQYRVPLIDLDDICRQLLQPQAPGWSALKGLLTDNFFTDAGELDRRVLRRAIFADAALRRRVDALLHPLARQTMTEQICWQEFPVVLVEIPLLFEAGWQDTVGLIIVVYAPVSVRLQRIIQRDQVSEEQARMAINGQQCLFKKAIYADHVIDNTRDWQQTLPQLSLLGSRLFGNGIFEKNIDRNTRK